MLENTQNSDFSANPAFEPTMILFSTSPPLMLQLISLAVPFQKMG